MWAPLLTEVLEELPNVNVVLSTSWVRHLGFKRARGYLPEAIQRRVIGATWHSEMARDWADQNWWDTATRYEQICRYVALARLPDWLSVDDDSAGWPDGALNHLVLCDGASGLANPLSGALLRARLGGL
jgi:hypothetical protein